MKFITIDDASLLTTKIARRLAELRFRGLVLEAAVARIEQFLPAIDPEVVWAIADTVYDLPRQLTPHQVGLLILGSALALRVAEQEGVELEEIAG